MLSRAAAFFLVVIALGTTTNVAVLPSEGEGEQLVVTCLDGNVYGLNPNTGEQIWVFDSGGPLVTSTDPVVVNSDSNATIIPGIDGAVYLYHPEQGLQVLGDSQEFVMMAPFVDNGRVFLGNKQTKFFSIDTRAGTADRLDDVDGDFSPQCFEDGPPLFFGRSDFTVRSVDTATGVERWNVTVARFTPTIFPFMQDEEDTSSFSDLDGTLVLTDRGKLIRTYENGESMWVFSTESVVTATYILPRGSNTVRKIATANERATMKTVDTDENLWDSTLYVGITDGQMWASPVPLLSDKEPQKLLGPGSKVVGLLPDSPSTWPRDGCQPGSPDFPFCLEGSHVIGTKRNDALVVVDEQPYPTWSDEVPEEGSRLWVMGGALSMAVLGMVGALLWRWRASMAVRPATPSKKKGKRKRDGSQPTATVSAPADMGGARTGPLTIGKMSVGRKVLGHGSHGTVVFEGTFESRTVAIKRMVASFYDLAEHEINAIMQSDEHPNVVRYYAKEEDPEGHFIYLALERCECTLEDLVKNGGKTKLLDSNRKPTRACVSLLAELCQGVRHLHGLNIVHRDIKPSNLLISRTASGKIADFGQMRKLEMERSSFDTHGFGTKGWQAPEVITGSGRCTRAVDVFSLGLVIFYILSGGGHPFGDRLHREANITKGRSDLRAIHHLPEACDLVSNMIHPQPQSRVGISEVENHVFFWPPDVRLAFLVEASDRIEIDAQITPPGPLVDALEAFANEVIGNDGWLGRLDEGLVDNLGKYRKYDTTSLRDLLRVIRNKRSHYQDLPEDVQLSLGPLPGGFLNYFLDRFPRLAICVVKACEPVRDEPQFAPYFSAHNGWAKTR